MFWNIENIPNNRIALIDDISGKAYTYGELVSETGKLSDHIKIEEKSLIFLFCDNSAPSVIGYLYALRSGHSVYLANSKMDSGLKKTLINRYKPEIILSIICMDEIVPNYRRRESGIELLLYTGSENKKEINSDLAVLLSTSGTTGSPKLVRLSYNNLQSNAESIAEYLSVNSGERPATTLPISYSFGLSVLNSHLLKGASVFCTEKSMVMRDFWNLFNDNKCTSFAGVPYNYQLLKRLKIDLTKIPNLTTITQAGGRLSEEFIKYFYDLSKKSNIRFFVMYGQTEATARISYVPYEKLGNKIGSIGIPIPKGKIKIYQGQNEITMPGTEGELVYSGPNVMLGYAESRDDLIKGDEYKCTLRTGDLAYKDNDGFIYITGRLKRFIKLFGLRVNLDEVEKMIENNFGIPAACFGTDDRMNILIQSSDEKLAGKVNEKVLEIYKIHHSVIKVKNIISIPVNASGKRDYKTLQETEL